MEDTKTGRGKVIPIDPELKRVLSAGIDGFCFHDFRHTAIDNWREDGHDSFKIMAASGHKTVSVFKRRNMVDEAELKMLISPVGTSVGTTAQSEDKKRSTRMRSPLNYIVPRAGFEPARGGSPEGF